MRYCPKCRSEYQDWVKVCIDCRAELGDHNGNVRIVVTSGDKEVRQGDEKRVRDRVIRHEYRVR